MSWGLAAVAGASLVSGVIGSNASKDAAAQQRAGVDAGIASQERMFDKSLELQEPYREAGYEALTGLRQLVDPQGRAEMLQGYYTSPEYSQMSSQVEEQQLRNAAATGGLRGGGNQAALATIAPQLGQQYLSSQYNGLTGLANMGMGAASQGSAQGMQLGGNISALQQQAAQAGAANSIAQANIWGNTVGDLAGAFGRYMDQPSGGKGQGGI